MNQVLKLFSFEDVDILLKNLLYRIEESDIIFYKETDLSQQIIVYNSSKSNWIFRESYIYTGGDQEVNREFESLKELIKEIIVPYFYQIPDEHVKNIFALWTKDWIITVDETEELIRLKFARRNEYFYYPLMKKEKYNSYVRVHQYSSVDVFDTHCSKDGKHCSKNIFLDNLLEDNYR